MASESSQACPECLRRSWLLALLGPYIERIATGSPGARSPELLRLSNEDLLAAAAPKVAGQLLERIAALSERGLEEELLAARCWACCRHGDLYPAGLRDAADAPWALICRGDRGLLDGLEPFGAVTVVGSRRATSYGREVARELGRELASAGMVVVSGLAFGIDACAHRGAVDAGRTIAVLGCGPDTAYPTAHRSLWRRISEEGLVVSEFPPGAAPWRWTFPARNRIMAALAGMTVVVEAAARSGSLITADLAADLGRDLGAVPGPVTSRASAGPNNLLAGGACVVRDAQDVLDAMLGPGAVAVDRTGPPLDSSLAAVLAAVEAGADGCDGVAVALDLPGADAAAALARLESLGYVTCSPMGVYSRTLLAASTGAGI
ncbi:MAG TPA: DNA-processing protein DprA [Solirubrobacterales bacterium]|nr:DNA-processing protein DprA [Solirubrobacterales bacterium]